MATIIAIAVTVDVIIVASKATVTNFNSASIRTILVIL